MQLCHRPIERFFPRLNLTRRRELSALRLRDQITGQQATFLPICLDDLAIPLLA